MTIDIASNPKIQRMLEMNELYESGLTLAEIGERYNVTRERVRQILVLLDDSRSHKLRRDSNRHHKMISEFVTEHPGLTVGEVSEVLGVCKQVVMKYADKSLLNFQPKLRGKDAKDRARKIYDLADSGMNAKEIAEEVDLSVNRIRQILKERKL